MQVVTDVINYAMLQPYSKDSSLSMLTWENEPKLNSNLSPTSYKIG